MILGGRATPYIASLRVYEPARAFSPSFLKDLVSYPATVEGFVKEEFFNLRRLVLSNKAEDDALRAFSITNDGANFYCPWNTPLRVRESLALIRESYSLPMRKLFSLPEINELKVNENNSNSTSRANLISETWLIPPRWFSLFSKGDCLSGKRGEKVFVFYRSNLKYALERGNRALAIIRKTFGPGPLTGEVEELMSWLASFDPESLIELDYGGLAELLDKLLLASGEMGVASDTSVDDVWESLEALEIGDGVRAGSAYERLMGRWRAVSSLEHAN